MPLLAVDCCQSISINIYICVCVCSISILAGIRLSNHPESIGKQFWRHTLAKMNSHTSVLWVLLEWFCLPAPPFLSLSRNQLREWQKYGGRGMGSYGLPDANLSQREDKGEAKGLRTADHLHLAFLHLVRGLQAERRQTRSSSMRKPPPITTPTHPPTPTKKSPHFSNEPKLRITKVTRLVMKGRITLCRWCFYLQLRADYQTGKLFNEAGFHLFSLESRCIIGAESCSINTALCWVVQRNCIN